MRKIKRAFSLFFLLLLLFSSVPNSFCQSDSKKPTGGHWTHFRSNPAASEEPDNEISSIMPLSYLQGNNPPPLERGVVQYDKKHALNGFNLFTSGHAPTAFLTDMQGNIVHTWQYDAKHIWPQDSFSERIKDWIAVQLTDNGDLYAMYSDVGFIKIDKDSRLLWSYNKKSHHPFDVDKHGNLYILTSSEISLDQNKIFDDYIGIWTPDGKFVRKISVLGLFKKLPNASFLKQIKYLAKKTQFDAEMSYVPEFGLEICRRDVFHTNSVQIFDGSLAKRSPLFKKGNALIGIRNLGIIAIVDLDKEEFVWIMKPKLWKPGMHNATLLNNGHILIFDNLYTANQSRVVEIDPLTMSIVWEYPKETGEYFYSQTGGACQRLPNGNTLITESKNGRAFEVTQQGKMVWEFINPYRTGKNNEWIAALFRVTRLGPGFLLDWLKK